MRAGGFSLPKLRLCVGGGCFVDPGYLNPSPQCPLYPGSGRLPLLPAARKEAASIIHLNVSIKQGYDQDETRNKVFYCKNTAPRAWPQGTLPQHCRCSQLLLLEGSRSPDGAEGFCPEFFFLPFLDPSKGLPRAFIFKEKSSDLDFGGSHGVLKAVCVRPVP